MQICRAPFPELFPSKNSNSNNLASPPNEMLPIVPVLISKLLFYLFHFYSQSQIFFNQVKVRCQQIRNMILPQGQHNHGENENKFKYIYNFLVEVFIHLLAKVLRQSAFSLKSLIEVRPVKLWAMKAHSNIPNCQILQLMNQK
jgi:hypothetical protein